ncbi:MAG TPA: hypothetical protein VIZ17_00105, partial [Acetobacteraceae bacterium]
VHSPVAGRAVVAILRRPAGWGQAQGRRRDCFIGSIESNGENQFAANAPFDDARLVSTAGRHFCCSTSISALGDASELEVLW